MTVAVGDVVVGTMTVDGVTGITVGGVVVNATGPIVAVRFKLNSKDRLVHALEVTMADAADVTV